MRLSLSSVSSALLLLAAGTAQAASSWGFDDGSVLVSAPKSGADSVKQRFNQNKPLSTSVSLGTSETLKIGLTAKDNGKGKRPHQAFVVLKEQDTGVEAPFPLTVKDDGKAIAKITHKDLPVQLLLSSKPLKGSVVIASFGSAQGLETPVFDVDIKLDPNVPPPKYEKPVRYGKKDEINHIFRPDARSPPKVISLFFVLAVLSTLPVLFISWLVLGANVSHLTKAFNAAPLSHASFFSSIIAMEFVFFLYYTSWNLFQTLPVMGLVGVVAFLSGKGALGEIKSRRISGER